MPDAVRNPIHRYLSGLPGFNPERGAQQQQVTVERHRRMETCFGRILSTFADVYGHIFKTPTPQIDMHDVVSRRRILLVMLPCLEKSGDELADLGRIVLSMLKAATLSHLGIPPCQLADGPMEAPAALPRRIPAEPGRNPFSATSPFLAILDEVGYYTVDGFALMAAQAGSLGLAMVYGAHDLPALRRLDQREADAIVALTNIRVVMRMEDFRTPPARAGRQFPWLDPGDNEVEGIGELPAGDMVLFHKGRRLGVRGVRFEGPDRSTTGRLRIRANHLYGFIPSAGYMGESA
jgi:intracellular multiplication protein IcmO